MITLNPLTLTLNPTPSTHMKHVKASQVGLLQAIQGLGFRGLGFRGLVFRV